MSIDGKRDGFVIGDLQAVAETASMKRGHGEEILAEVTEAVESWPELAVKAEIEEERVERIATTHRFDLQ